MSKPSEPPVITAQETKSTISGPASKNLNVNLQEMVQDLGDVDYGDLDFINQTIPEEYQETLDSMIH